VFFFLRNYRAELENFAATTVPRGGATNMFRREGVEDSTPARIPTVIRRVDVRGRPAPGVWIVIKFKMSLQTNKPSG